jgi:hypothetical protein
MLTGLACSVNDTWESRLHKDEQRFLVEFDNFLHGKQQEVSKATLLCSLEDLVRPHRLDQAWSSIMEQLGRIEGLGGCTFDELC